MTAFYASMSEENAPPTRKLHQYYIAEPYQKGRYLNYWGYSKDEALKKAKLNNPNANVILWKKVL
jgi:hypothetical protein|tara:strand:+ start:891 stop:1085 length:195 start_codon:yes stop_codon:yes gene_type:complete